MSNFTSDYDPLSTTEYNYDGVHSPCDIDYVHNIGSRVIPILYSLVLIFGLLGNALVVLILIKYKKFKSMTDIYLFNLCIADLLFIASLPFWAYSAAVEWIFGNEACKLVSGLYITGFYGGSFFIILLTIDRYLAIVYAVFALKARTAVYGIITSAVTWGVALLAAVPAFVFMELRIQNNQSTCSFNFPHETQNSWYKFMTLKMNIIGLILPMIVMTVCYAQIILTLKKCRNDKKNKRNKAVKLIFIIMIIYFLFWAPFNVASFLNAFKTSFDLGNCEDHNKLTIAIQVTESLAMAHCCVNPVIYAFVAEKFRKYISSFFQKHVALHLPKACCLLYSEPLERASSTYSQSTGEHEISALF